MEAKDRIIVALDTQDPGQALALVKKLEPFVGCFKIGLEFITSALVNLLQSQPHEAAVMLANLRMLFSETGGKLFWDGKWNDIPNTVKGAMIGLQKLLPFYENIHASSGIEAIREAAANKGSSKLLVVTVLTSLEENEAHLIFGAPSKAKVLQFARYAKLAGADGIICSPQELEILAKAKELANLEKITPGVRPSWAAANDQKRVMTPKEAILAGATALVIGRPITNPPKEIGDPVEAAKKIADEIEAAQASRTEAKKP